MRTMVVVGTENVKKKKRLRLRLSLEIILGGPS